MKRQHHQTKYKRVVLGYDYDKWNVHSISALRCILRFKRGESRTSVDKGGLQEAIHLSKIFGCFDFWLINHGGGIPQNENATQLAFAITRTVCSLSG